jgi:hypothetical protein
MNIEGRDASYSETLALVAALMDAERLDRERIAELSAESARDYLHDLVIRIAEALGMAVAQVAAIVVDVLQIAKNAGHAFSEAYRDSYMSARRIKPYGA